MRSIFMGLLVLLFAFSAYAAEDNADVIALVNKTVEDIKADALGTFKKITAGEHPYKDKDQPAKYIFVYDENVNMMAHPKKVLVGHSYKGKPDVRGKKFRDELVAVALEKGNGWVEYSYQKPGESGIHKKKTYCQKVTGSDGKIYIVCCGSYSN